MGPLSWPALLRLSLTQPKAAAEALLLRNIAPPQILQLTALALVISGVLGYFGNVASPMPLGGEHPLSPLGMFIFVAVAYAVWVVCLVWVGRYAGGKGTLFPAMLLLTWVQFIRIAMQLFTILVLALIPPLGFLVIIAGLFLIIWITVAFVQVLHGFDTGVRSFGVLLGASFLVLVAMLIFVSITGVQIQGVPQ